MTPRTVRGTPNIDFARQVAVQQREQHDTRQQSNRRFRSSAAPKGTKLAPGYRDRTQDRLNDDGEEEEGKADRVGTNGQDTNAEGDDRARRVRALEESMKLGQIDRATFEKLRDDITGGDIRATHLVKGLDRRLLERVRRGEDVLSGNGNVNNSVDSMTNHKRDQSPQEVAVNIEDEFAQLEQKEVTPMAREKTVKKGIMAPPPPPSVAGAKRSRNAILAQLKASRQSQAESDSQEPTFGVNRHDDGRITQPQLGSKFRRIGEKEETSRIERDERGREVLVVRDRNGKIIKRKVRKASHVSGQNGSGKKGAAQNDGRDDKGLLLPTNTAQPLGAEVSDLVSAAAAAAKKGAVEGNMNMNGDEADIFEGIGTDYDPLSPSDGENEHDDDRDAANNIKTRGSDDDDENNSGTETAPTSKHPDKTSSEAETRTDKDISTIEKHEDSSGETSSTARQDQQPFRPRNYFATKTTSNSTSNTTSTSVHSNLNTSISTSTSTTNPLSDPTLLSALKKASAIHQSNNNTTNTTNNPSSASSSSFIPQLTNNSNNNNNNNDNDNDNTTLHARLQARARASDRDLEDLDLGFGSSRFDDAEDMALDADLDSSHKKGRNRLAEWDGGDGGGGIGGDDEYDHGEDEQGKKGQGKKKRQKAGKRKGDKNNVDDIMGLAERLRGDGR